MGLRGTIEDFKISEIIQLIGQQSKTGILTVWKSNKEVRIFFVNGNVVRVEPDRSERKMLMGEMLITSGKITREQLESALEEQKGTVQYLGEILLKRKLVTKEDIQKIVHTQIYETIYELFQWNEGIFEFETREKSEYLKILPSLSPEQLLLNVSWMVDEWQLIEKTIPTMNVVFEKVPTDRRILLEETDEDKGLTYNQKIVYDLVDGKRTVQEIVEKSLMGRFDTCNILSELLQLGYIRKAKVEKAPIYQRIELRSSNFVFHLVSIVLVALSLYFAYRYVGGVYAYKNLYSVDLSLSEETQKRDVVIPMLYERVLHYRVLTRNFPNTLNDLWIEGLLSDRETSVFTEQYFSAYLRVWKENPPF